MQTFTTETGRTAQVSSIIVTHGIAGHVMVTAVVTHPGERPGPVRFYGSSYGGPVWMQTPGIGVWVTEPQRFGPALDRAWVEAFFGVAR